MMKEHLIFVENIKYVKDIVHFVVKIDLKSANFYENSFYYNSSFDKKNISCCCPNIL